MKVGTDGVLLGAWCSVASARRILDIGCGTGLISLMLAQRNGDARIDAVEIDSLASEEAAENFRNSDWGERLKAHNADILDFLPEIHYDLIVSNPPFFENGVVAPDKRRAIARHAGNLTFDGLFRKASELLAPGGIFAIIAPDVSKSSVEFYAGEYGFWIKRRVGVQTTKKKPIKRYLWEFVMHPVELEEGVIVIKDSESRFGTEFEDIVKDFYLKM